MYTKLSSLVSWPKRSELMKNYEVCGLLSLTAHAQTWSNYKHHNTIKFLIGIAPQGSVAYIILQSWGGRTSYVHLTENSRLLQNLMPEDVILADRGLTIQETAGLYCVKVKLPPFTRGKNQLSKVEVVHFQEYAFT